MSNSNERGIVYFMPAETNSAEFISAEFVKEIKVKFIPNGNKFNKTVKAEIIFDNNESYELKLDCTVNKQRIIGKIKSLLSAINICNRNLNRKE